MGLLSAAFGGAMGARRGTPWNNIGRAGIAGLTGYSQAQSQLDKTAQETQERQLREMQLKKLKEDLDHEGRAAEIEALSGLNDPTAISRALMRSKYNELRKSGTELMGKQLLNTQEQTAYDAAMRKAMNIAPASTLSGMEPVQNGVPDQQGMAGNVNQLIQQTMADPQIPSADKMAIVAQIKQQAQAGGKAELNPYALIGSGSQRAAELGKAIQAQQFRHDEARLKAMEIAAKGDGSEKVPVTYKDPITGKYIIGRLTDAVGKEAPLYDPTIQARVAAGKETGKGAGEYNTKQYEQAASAHAMLGKLNQVEKEITNSEFKPGIFSDFRLALNKAQAMLGGPEGSKKAEDAEVMNALMGQDVFSLLGAMGLGSKQMDTPAEREFMRQVLAGTITMERGALQRLAGIRKQDAQSAIDRFNTRVDSGELDDFFTNSGYTKKKFEYQKENATSADVKPEGKKAMQSKPPAQQHKGRVIRDTETGKLLRSNGMTWVEER